MPIFFLYIYRPVTPLLTANKSQIWKSRLFGASVSSYALEQRWGDFNAFERLVVFVETLLSHLGVFPVATPFYLAPICVFVVDRSFFFATGQV